MKLLFKTLAVIVIVQISVVSSVLGGGVELNLWPGGAPGKVVDATDTAKVYVYLPDARTATGRAIVICPGGGYQYLAIDYEGQQWAEYLSGQGIAAIVLKYRMPHGNREIPIADAMEAMRMVRRNASTWGINPSEVGIMGFSAGGHLASVVATTAKDDALPNFQILFYPVITMDPGFTHKGSHDNLLGQDPRKRIEHEYSSDRQVSRMTPRAFIALSDDDRTVLPANGVNYYLACYRHDVPATLHVYATGGHGWGLKRSFPYHVEMLLDLNAWLRSF